MLALVATRAAARGFVLALFVASAALNASSAVASPKAKKVRSGEPAAPFALAARPSTATPVRYFTINQVLAKHDGREHRPTLRFAAVDRAGTMTDAPNPLPSSAT